MKEFTPPSVDDIQVMPAAGPWPTKSGGELMVTMKMPLQDVQEKYLAYDQAELDPLPQDIRGLRIYTVRKLPQERIGGMEWHRVREEMIFVLEGSVLWECEDLYGNKRSYTLDGGAGIWMPPFILHTYTVLAEGSGLLVMANTLFIPDDPATHDTYSLEAFKELQNRI